MDVCLLLPMLLLLLLLLVLRCGGKMILNQQKEGKDEPSVGTTDATDLAVWRAVVDAIVIILLFAKG